ncbi:MAG: hypothetical protein JRI25_08140 [Deltaproteobacteria bacterium]|nr:hypothetical protein [Deltaproteobacteria bacterium]
MAIPKFDEFTRPMLEALAEQPGPVPIAGLYERAVDWAGLTPEERTQRLSNGQQTYKNRVGWALTWMKHADWVVNSRRGYWAITDSGRERLERDGALITAAELRPFADPRTRERRTKAVLEAPTEDQTLTPWDQIDEALRLIRQSVKADLLQRLHDETADFFERIGTPKAMWRVCLNPRLSRWCSSGGGMRSSPFAVGPPMRRKRS